MSSKSVAVMTPLVATEGWVKKTNQLCCHHETFRRTAGCEAREMSHQRLEKVKCHGFITGENPILAPVTDVTDVIPDTAPGMP